MGLLLLPLYAAYLPPNDYGILAVARVVITISIAVFSFGLNGAAFKFYYDIEQSDRKRFYGTLWLFLLIIPAIFLVLIELSVHITTWQLFKHVPYAPYVRIALWTSYLSIAFRNLTLELLKAAERAATYTFIGIVQAACMIAVAFWLVGYLKMGAVGALLANLIGVCVAALVSLICIYPHISLSLDLSFLKRAMVFGLPLMPHFLAHWALAASDRVVLERYVPMSDVGVYSVGYAIGSAMLLFITSCNSAILPIFGRVRSADSPEALTASKMSTYFVLAVTFVALSLAMFSEEIVALLVPQSYCRAAMVVPWVVAGYFCMGLYCIPTNSIVQIAGRTKAMPVYTLSAGIVNIVLNVVLIPIMGMAAAAVTTAITYLLLFLLMFALAQRTVPLPYEYGRLCKVILTGILLFALGFGFAPNALGSSLAWKSLLLLCFPFVLWVTGFLNAAEYGAITARFRRKA